MEEKTLFKLARAITDTGTDTVSSEGGTVTYRITSLKRKLVNGKVVSTSTPSCTLTSASVSWATWGGVTVGDGYLDVKISYSKNTGSSRSATLTFAQNGSNNKINLTVTQEQEAGVTYSGYIKMVSNTLPLGSNKYDTAQILVMAYLKGSDGSKKPETLHVGSAPDWCSVSVTSMDTLEYYMLSLTALSSNLTLINRSGHIFLTCGDANLSIPVTQKAREASTFTLSGLPTGTGYYLFGRGAKPQNTSHSDMSYIQSISATSTTTMNIPFDANASEPGIRITCNTGDIVTVYTKSGGATWILEGSFIVPSAGETVSI
nr:MAG: hypothetical protein [Bacteriophage sp.]